MKKFLLIGLVLAMFVAGCSSQPKEEPTAAPETSAAPAEPAPAGEQPAAPAN